MALLALRLGHHHHLIPAQRRIRSGCQRLVVSCSAAQVSGAALVWFKHDLRLDDHPGLVAACAEPRRPVVPLYVFDRRILAGYSDTMLELLLFALKDLKLALKLQQSDLLIALGNAEDVVLKLANEVQAGVIYTEEEVEHSVHSVLANVESSLSNGSFTWGNPPEIELWSAPLYDYKEMAPFLCYVVYIGRVPGVYERWQDCHMQVNRFPGNRYKGYMSRAVAEENWRNHLRQQNRTRTRTNFIVTTTTFFFVVACVFYFFTSRA